MSPLVMREVLVSLSDLVGAPVVGRLHREIGRLADVVVRLGEEDQPTVTGLVVEVGQRRAFVPVERVELLGVREVVLRSAELDLRDVQRRPGEVLLAEDVLDRQLVDVDGRRVVRASDLYLLVTGEVPRLVGVDVGLRSFLRRLLPRRWRTHPRPHQVIDWAVIQPFGGQTHELALRAPARELHRLRPGELADLVEDLARPARQELLASLDPDAASDVLEEMDPGEREALLRETETDRAAELVAGMEPDEAVDALRDLDLRLRGELLERMPRGTAEVLEDLLRYPEATAGGIMTTALVSASGAETVSEVTARLRVSAHAASELGEVVVVDDQQRVVDTVSALELLLASPDDRLESLVSAPWPVTIPAEAKIGEVVEALIENRGSSLVVVDERNRPLGRILADDVIDALVPERGRLRFPRL